MAMENDDIFVLSGGGRNLVNIKNKGLDDYTIPSSVTAIGKKAFKGCSSLIEINVPGSVKNIGADAFVDCTSLFVIRISEGVETIGKGAFRNCTVLKEVYLPKSLNKIGNEAFMNCPSIRRIKIPEGVTIIGSSCFSDCKSLDTIVLPNSLCSIGSLCFSKCSNLKNVFLRQKTPHLLTIDEKIISRNDYVKRTLYVPYLKVSLFQQHPFSKYFNYLESEQSPELTDWSFSEKRFLYIPKEKIEERGIPGLIILKLAGEPDIPSINQYLCSKIERIEKSSEFNQQLAIYKDSWNNQELKKRGWTSSMIIKYAGNPDLDLTSDTVHEQYEMKIKQSQYMPLFFHLKSKILQIEQSEAFINEIEFKDNCFTRWDLYRRGWHDCLIDWFKPNIQDENSYYKKSRIIQIENDGGFQKCLYIINNSWSKDELLDQGWSMSLIRKLLPNPNLQFENVVFYLKDRVEKIKKSKAYKELLNKEYLEMLEWCQSGKMTLSDFMDQISFTIPIIDKDQLINDACDSFNAEIDSHQYYDGIWLGDEWYGVDYVYPDDDIRRVAKTCMDYLRHKLTPYDDIWRSLRRIFYDDYENHHYALKRCVNDAIRKTYPWIGKYC